MDHYSIGFTDYLHRGETIRSLVGSKEAEAYIRDVSRTNNVQIGYIPEGFQFRPDLIAETFYDSPSNWWTLLVYSNIPDFKDLKVMKRLIIPNKL